MLDHLYRSSSNPETSESQLRTLSIIAILIHRQADYDELSADPETRRYVASWDRLYSLMGGERTDERPLGASRWMGDLFQQDMENGTHHHEAFMADTDGLAKLVVRPAIWELFILFGEWPEWYELVEHIHTMNGLTHGDAARALNLAKADPDTGVHALLATHLLAPDEDVSRMGAFRWVLGIREMCEEESHRRKHRVSPRRLERVVMEGLT